MTNPTLEDLPSPKEVSDISPEEFGEQVTSHYEPLVVRGLARDWPIVRAAGVSAETAAEYLKKFDTGRPLPLVVAPLESGGRLMYNEDHTGFNFTREQTTLSDGLERIVSRTEHIVTTIGYLALAVASTVTIWMRMTFADVDGHPWLLGLYFVSVVGIGISIYFGFTRQHYYLKT